MPRPVRLAYVTTSGMSVRYLLAGQLAEMRRSGFDVAVLCTPDRDLDAAVAGEGVQAIGIPFDREIAPLRDLRSLVRLVAALRRVRPDVVNAGTPKAALLGMVAAALLRVPVRIYLLRGLRSETTRGLRRLVLELAERITSSLAHRVVCVSPSLRDAYVGRGLCPRAKTSVLGSGSSNGVDAERFRRDERTRARIRSGLGFDPGDVVIGFVGRLTRDKGIAELLDAFARVRGRVPVARLLVIGDPEHGDPLPDHVLARLAADPDVTHLGHVPDVSAHYSAMDVLAFPSYREGFPNVVLEAASAGLPAVGFRATGTVDAIVDGTTGAVVRVGDSEALGEALARYAEDGELRKRHGESGRRMVETSFRRETVWNLLKDLYRYELERRAPGRLA